MSEVQVNKAVEIMWRVRLVLTVSCVLYLDVFTYSILKNSETSQYPALYVTLSKFVQIFFVLGGACSAYKSQSCTQKQVPQSTYVNFSHEKNSSVTKENAMHGILIWIIVVGSDLRCTVHG